ncbi:hypothetical protein UFOVP169_4 [uncultured Caudovirales phage]|uniref:Uncharacterized protein n=1 Tax=uncultured Caudovirales phage TaxID=2100421 RepID=A0A6J7WEJ0_9CAUD|nr:hypothetical protein UFOVP169_4 [uncultured Caudovirales phage]
MSVGLKGNADGSGAIQVGGTDAITITTSLNATFAGTAAVPTGTLYPIVSGTVKDLTNGGANNLASWDYTSIPSWVKRITIMINGLSTTGTSDPLIQLGTSAGGVLTSGYVSGASTTTAGSGGFSSTAGIALTGGWSAAFVWSGTITLVLQDAATNTWTAVTSGGRTDTAGGTTGGGYKATTTALDRIRLTTVTGVQFFDAGTMNIVYE